MQEAESWSFPPKQALYDPTLERDACGVGFIVAIDGKKSHKVSYHATVENPTHNFYHISLVIVFLFVSNVYPFYFPTRHF